MPKAPNSLKRAKPLQKGDVIRIVASSSPFDRKAFLAGVRILESWGYQVQFRPDVFAKLPYLAGSDERRAEELIEALQDPEAKAILFARGGYGSVRLLPYLDRMRTPRTPKLVLGYSDITSILIYLQERFGWTTFYGPVVAKDLGPKSPSLTLDSLHLVLATAAGPATMRFSRAKIIRPGKARGELVGGCLTLIAAHLGTPYDLHTDGKILFLEDVNEKPYQIDRLLTHLRLAGKFRRCRGVLIGSMAGPNPPAHYLKTLSDFFARDKFPVVAGLPFGHVAAKLCLPLGVPVSLTTGRGATLEF